MQSFKLSGNYRVSKLFKEQSGKTRPKQQVKDRGLDRFSQHLSALAYVMCSSLIVYSLLTFNGLLADDATLSKANLLAKAAKPLALAGQEYLYNAWYIGQQIDNPLVNTIQLYSNSLSKLFLAAGKALSAVPKMLTWAPPVRAKTLVNSYW